MRRAEQKEHPTSPGETLFITLACASIANRRSAAINITQLPLSNNRIGSADGTETKGIKEKQVTCKKIYALRFSPQIKNLFDLSFKVFGLCY
jgi:hypothetical protein